MKILKIANKSKSTLPNVAELPPAEEVEFILWHLLCYFYNFVTFLWPGVLFLLTPISRHVSNVWRHLYKKSSTEIFALVCKIFTDWQFDLISTDPSKQNQVETTCSLPVYDIVLLCTKNMSRKYSLCRKYWISSIEVENRVDIDRYLKYATAPQLINQN